MADKTYPQLSEQTTVQDADLLASWRPSESGPLKKLQALVFKTYVLLGLGTAAEADTGTSGHTLGFLDGANTYSAAQTFDDDVNMTGGGALAGTFTGDPVISGNPSFTGVPALSEAATVGGYELPGLLLDSGVITSSTATLDVTLPSGFRHYRLYVQGLEPVTDGAQIWLRASVDSGSTYLTTSSYVYAGYATTSASNGPIVSSLTSQTLISGALSNSTGLDSGFFVDIWTEAGLNGRLKYAVNHAAQTSFDTVNLDGSARVITVLMLTNIRMLFSTGNISKARWMLEGVRGL